MDDLTRTHYYRAEFFRDLAYDHNFKLVDSIAECDDLERYVFDRMIQPIANRYDHPQIATYLLNLTRAMYRLTALDNNASSILDKELSENRLGLEDNTFPEQVKMPILYACYISHRIYNSQITKESLDLLADMCKDVPEEVKKAFSDHVDLLYCGGKLLLNWGKLLDQKIEKIKKEEGIEAALAYCKEYLPYYEDAHNMAPTWEENENTTIFFQDGSELTPDDKDELDICVSSLKHSIKEFEDIINNSRPSLDALLDRVPKLKPIQAFIQYAIDKGYIVYREGAKLGDKGVLLPVVGQDSFPSDSSFAYFIACALKLQGTNKQFPSTDVHKLFYGKTESGKDIDWAAYWRQQKRQRVFYKKTQIADADGKLRNPDWASRKTYEFVMTIMEEVEPDYVKEMLLHTMVQ